MKGIIGVLQIGWFLTLLISFDLQSQKLPDLAEVKIRAENGDPVSQEHLARAYESRFDWKNAEFWYRKAAEHRSPSAQFGVARMMLHRGEPFVQNPNSFSAEILEWILRAANQNHQEAQKRAGDFYSKGVHTSTNIVEGYKWYSLAARSGSLMAKALQDSLILKMSRSQLQEGERLVSEFKPSHNPPPPDPFSFLKLQGLTGTSDNPLAIISGKTLAPGEEVRVANGTNSILIKCERIDGRSVLISSTSFKGMKELNLR